MVTKRNFWTGGPIFKIRVPKQVLRRRENVLYISQISIGPHFDPAFAKNWFKPNVFANTRASWRPIKIWLNHKNFFRLLGTCLGTLIFKIGPPNQKLHLVTIFCHIGFFDFQFVAFSKKREEKRQSYTVTFDWVDPF